VLFCAADGDTGIPDLERTSKKSSVTMNSIEGRLQFQTLPPDLNEWPIAEKRFKAILGSLAADFTILPAHLRQSWKSVINPGSECSVDEAIFDFSRRPTSHLLKDSSPANRTQTDSFAFMAGLRRNMDLSFSISNQITR